MEYIAGNRYIEPKELKMERLRQTYFGDWK